jgi:hypothetical protein
MRVLTIKLCNQFRCLTFRFNGYLSLFVQTWDKMFRIAYNLFLLRILNNILHSVHINLIGRIVLLFDVQCNLEGDRVGNRRGAITNRHTCGHLSWLLISIINKYACVPVCLSSTHRFVSNQSLCLQVDLFIGRLVKAVIHSVPMALW